MRTAKQLTVFVKEPRPGAVKTRLAGEIGVDAACKAYERLVSALLRRIESFPGLQLRFSPDDAEPTIRLWARPGWTLAPQGPGNLGDRLGRAFSEAFEGGASSVVVIGSDCPWIEAEDIERAWGALQETDLVLGPAQDGGYWLIGLRAPAAGLFAEIAWSTPRVLEQTLERAKIAGLRFQLLRELRDVDTLADWRRFLDDNTFA
jgi:uncharacterized protein